MLLLNRLSSWLFYIAFASIDRYLRMFSRPTLEIYSVGGEEKNLSRNPRIFGGRGKTCLQLQFRWEAV